jgi:PAS domain S-box-containing protein
MEKRVNILVVEDERIVARDIRRIIEGFGYIVPAIVSTGEKAVQEAKNLHPDLVLMDIVLEGKMTGIDAAEEIRNRFSIPVIYLTAYSDRDTVKSAKETMPYGYLLKPVNEDELRTTVETALYKHKMEMTLVESERRYRLLAENIADVIWTMDMNMQFTYISPSVTALSGRTPDEFIELGIDKCLTPDSLNIINKVFKEETSIEASGSGDPSRTRMLELELVRKDGSIIWIECRVSSLRAPDGRMVGVLGAICDITNRKRAKEKLEQSYRKLQETLEGIINTLALTVEIRDPYTAGHQLRVTQLANAIAMELDLSEEQIRGIHMASRIHDVGKINVPAEILSKPGKLTENEFNLLKSHSQTGYDILKNVDFPWPIAKIVLQHHERMDGSGYPQGLKGEEILLAARIIGVADVVEAMVSHRPYRPALGIEEALKEISLNRGVLYDSQVVDACLKLFTEKGFAFK